MNSPEKISSNILTDRLKKLLRFNLIEFYVCPKNKKIKKYFLTNSGIELYPIIYDMHIWAKKNLDIEFESITNDWYKKNHDNSPEQTIQKDVSDYEVFKKRSLKLF
jgi:DNA-binding HxlR family transcriptional regulator|tara:strand:- start:366 stop:683 length:318 start_codon:yes stop_codon:yes gene_type:complete